MSRRWLLSLLCLFLTCLVLLQIASAGGELKVDEPKTKVLLQNDPVVVQLSVANSLVEIPNAKVRLELLDPRNRVASAGEQLTSIGLGKQTLSLSLPFDLSRLLPADRRQILCYRLRYRITNAQQPEPALAEGIASLSQITPDLFSVRVSSAQFVREGMRYRSRVQTFHPGTEKPAGGVRVEAVVTLENDDQGNGVKIPASGVTDSAGYATLTFALPARFPEFPHEPRPSGGSIKVIARRGAVVAEAENDVLVDQFPRVLISTDKPLYQPGQVLHARALAFSPSKHAIANQAVNFQINDPEGTLVFRDSIKSTRFGIGSIDWPIPENTRLGDYMIKVSLGDDDDSSRSAVWVRISRYDLPNFSVKAKTDQPYYVSGQNAEVKISADYLFGEPVKRGKVRVVRETEREWNYREQKWDIEEGDKYEGETDANGAFVAHVDLSKDHGDLKDSDYRQFEDVTYAAYFTDPTTNRTEQRRFDLRVTKEAIHVYVIAGDDHYSHSYKLPLQFYVSTSYADGSPASCKVTLALADEDDNDEETRKATRPLATVRTNRYGLAKISTLRSPDEDDVDLKIVARDGRGKTGSRTADFEIEDTDEIRLETDKRLYQPGESITLELTSTVSNLNAIVDVAAESAVLSSQKVQLRGGRASITIPYKSEFKDKLTIAAYADFADSHRMIATRGILFPRKQGLEVDAQPARKNYRPGDEAQVSFRIRAPDGQPALAALGLVIVDKAVDERFRTDQEFGSRSSGFYGSAASLFGYDEQISGVSLRDLQRLDLSKPVPPDLALAAEVLLDQNRGYYPEFFGGDNYETIQATVFTDIVKGQLSFIDVALAARYEKTGAYPRTEAHLQILLAESGIDLALSPDPWGTHYRAIFSVDKQSDELSFESAGADKRFDTADDFSIVSNRWAYFRPIGEAIDRTVREYHARTGEFIRDFVTLRHEAAKLGLDLDSVRDRWDEPYRFDFSVDKTSYLIKVSSGGPNKEFSKEWLYGSDDFELWTSSIDYFAEKRSQIDDALNAEFQRTARVPQNRSELDGLLTGARINLNALHDAWGNAAYSVFTERSFFGDQVTIETRAREGEANQAHTDIKPVTLRALIVRLRSVGPDGKEGTLDDFDLVGFTGTVSEQSSKDAGPKPLTATVGFLSDTGGIRGVVTDQSGAAIAGATIFAKHSPSLRVFETTSNDAGEYLLRNLPPGAYEVRVEAPGFKWLVITSVPVSSSNVTELNLQPEAGAVTETVNVTASAETTNTASNTFVINATEQNRSVPGIPNSKTRMVTKSGTNSDQFTPRLREYFPETLLWQPSLETDSRGRAQLKFKLADNITTWRMSVLGSTENGEIGMAETEIQSFQPFFVEHDPPRILTEGDQISLPIVLRNYLERAQTVDLEMKPESWFALLGPARQSVNVAAGDAARQTFELKAVASIKDGKQRVTAGGAEASDAIEKPVTVHPDGEEKTQTESDVLAATANLNVDLPAAVLPGSTQAEIKVYPNLMAHVAESIAGILERPYGCGEQTISSTYPSLLWLRHNKQVASDSRLVNQAQRFALLGYQRLLNYRNEDGGFTYWGRGDADVALTAYALRFLHDAAEFVPVDEEVVQATRAWLIKQQRPDGSWSAYDYQSPDVESKRRTALLTAFVARVLALTGRTGKVDTRETGDTAKQPAAKPEASGVDSPELKRALAYVAARSDEIDEPYLIASYALAATDAGDASGAARATAKLRLSAHAEADTSYWALETNTPFYGWGLAGRVETTALAVQALARQAKTQSGQAATRPESDPLVRRGLLFLLRSKDRYGVWYSTQATVNVLDALVTLLATDAPATRQTAGPEAPEIVEVVINGQPAASLKLPEGNQATALIRADVSRFLQPGANRVELRRAAGAAVASVQLVANYYVPWSESAVTQASTLNPTAASSLRLAATFDKHSAKVSEEITCNVKAERVGSFGYGMLLAEIGLPPGADVDRASLETAMKSSGWTFSQYDILPDRVVVYLWPNAGGVEFSFKFRPRFALTAKNAPSVVYDYYNPEARAVIAPATFVVR